VFRQLGVTGPADGRHIAWEANLPPVPAVNPFTAKVAEAQAKVQAKKELIVPEVAEAVEPTAVQTHQRVPSRRKRAPIPSTSNIHRSTPDRSPARFTNGQHLARFGLPTDQITGSQGTNQTPTPQIARPEQDAIQIDAAEERHETYQASVIFAGEVEGLTSDQVDETNESHNHMVQDAPHLAEPAPTADINRPVLAPQGRSLRSREAVTEALLEGNITEDAYGVAWQMVRGHVFGLAREMGIEATGDRFAPLHGFVERKAREARFLHYLLEKHNLTAWMAVSNVRNGEYQSHLIGPLARRLAPQVSYELGTYGAKISLERGRSGARCWWTAPR
jgi:hypothetical protein